MSPESLEAVEAFAGPGYETAVFEPEARRLLSRAGPKALHYDVRVADVTRSPLAGYALLMPLSLPDLETRCASFVRAQMAANDPAHDVMHIERVVSNARQLAAAEGARLEIVMPAAWLHDCVTLPKDSPQRAQASRLAAAEATRMLAEWDCEPDWLPAIAHAIEAHSFTAGIEPRSIEAKAVQDADRLDALGAVGLSRTLMLGGFTRKPLYNPDDPFCESRTPDDRRVVIDHFYAKLLHLAGTMQTAAGRREAEVRTAFIERFIDELRRELEFSA